jgi:hypothetical protein
MLIELTTAIATCDQKDWSEGAADAFLERAGHAATSAAPAVQLLQQLQWMMLTKCKHGGLLDLAQQRKSMPRRLSNAKSTERNVRSRRYQLAQIAIGLLRAWPYVPGHPLGQ